MTLHTPPELTDYVLGLLSREEAAVVEQKAAVSPAYQRALAEERALLRHIQANLQETATTPTAAQLARLMPAPPAPRKGWWTAVPFAQPVTAFALLLLLVLGSFSLYTGGDTAALPTATIAATHQPTYTATPAATPISYRP